MPVTDLIAALDGALPFCLQSLLSSLLGGRPLATTPLDVRLELYSVAKRICRD